MWAITSYYNPVRSRRRLSNYKIFRANLRIPLVAVELSFDGQFDLTKDDADVVVQISGGAILWQKERLLNVALKSVPSNASTIAWIDCDVIFERLDWAAEAKAQLREKEVVQLFSEVVDLNSNEVAPRSGPADNFLTTQGIVRLKDNDEKKAFTIRVNNPTTRSVARGLAWAANRKTLEEHGFYDASIIGSGDRCMAYAMYGRFDDVMHALYMNEVQKENYIRWAARFHETVRGRVGYVRGRLFHLWHGNFQSRGYDERHKALLKYNFNPEKDIEIGPNGAWKWARPRTELADFLLRYFESRDEDGRERHNEHFSAVPGVGSE